MSWNEFLKAVYAADFHWSTRILSQSLKRGHISEIANQIKVEFVDDANASIRIRDYILWFLGLESLNLALNVTSPELLSVVGDCNSNLEARSKSFLWATEMIETGNPKFLQYVLEIDDISSSDFAPLIPDILTERLREFQKIRVSYSSKIVEDVHRDRYYIGNLWRTAYGRRLLVAVGVAPGTDVIGRQKWVEVSNALISLGCDVDDLLVEIGEYAWHELTQSTEKRIKIGNLGSRELVLLERCRNACLEIDSYDSSRVSAALQRLRELDTNTCNRKVAKIAQAGSLSEQAYAIDILSSTGGLVEQEILSDLLTECEPKIKRKVAEGLSGIVSREFSRSPSVDQRQPLAIAKEYSQRSSEKKVEILELLSRSNNRNARIDAAKSLAQLGAPAAEQILFRMCNDIDAKVRVEIVYLVPSMSRPLGIEIIHAALKDSSSVVRLAAIQTGKKIWPDQDWPDM